MTHPSQPHSPIRLRFQPSAKSRLGICLTYLAQGHYDLAHEVQTLLETRFLALALRPIDPESGLVAAHEAIGKLEGMIYMIQALYKIKRSKPCTDSASAQSVASDLSQDSEPQPDRLMAAIDDDEAKTNHFVFG
jgi:hypothetical protein